MKVEIGNFYSVWLPDMQGVSIMLVLEKDRYGGCHVLSEKGGTFFLEDTEEVKPLSEKITHPDYLSVARILKDIEQNGGDRTKKKELKESVERFRNSVQNSPNGSVTGNNANIQYNSRKTVVPGSKRRVLRVYGRSYTEMDVNGIGMEVCEKGGVEFKYAGVDGYNNCVMVVGNKNGQEVKKMVHLHELKNYKLVSRVNEQPYYQDSSYIFYRDDLEEAAQYFANCNFGKCVKFNLNHKNGTLRVYSRTGIRPIYFEYSFSDVDRYLMKSNMLGRR